MASTIVEVTPKLAAKWLERNGANRRLRDNLINKYGADMLARNWKLNGQTIVIDSEGDIVDGQHRLIASRRFEVAFKTYVVTGVEPVARLTVDTGASRSLADILRIKGESSYATLATALRLAWQYKELGFHRLGGGRLTPSNPTGTKRALGPYRSRPSITQFLEFLDQYPRLRISAGWAGAHTHDIGTLMTPRIAAFIHFALSEIHIGQAQYFCDRILDGSDLPADSPILKMRNLLFRDRAKVDRERKPWWEILALFFKSWNLWRDKRSCQVLMISFERGDKFPVPK